MTQTFLTEQQFVEYLLKELKSKFSEEVEIEQTDEFSLNIKLPKGTFKLSVGALWKEYEQTGTLATLDDLIRSVSNIEKDTNNIEDYDLFKNQEFLFHSVRSKETVENWLQSHDSDYSILAEDLIGNLQKVYFLWRDGYSVPINSTMLNIGTGLTVEEIKKIAEDNVRKQGWLEHRNVGDLKSGKIYQFNEGVQLFHSQFFNKEWIEEHLGDEFYFSFPTKDLAYVFVPRKNAKLKQVMIDRNFLVYNTLTDFKELSYKTSSMIFSYRKGDYNVVVK